MITEQQVMDALPRKGFVADYMATTYASTDAPLAFHLYSLISVMSSVMPYSMGVQEGFGKTLPIVWSLLLGKSGTRKTTAIKLACELMDGAGLKVYQGRKPGSYQGLITSLNEQPTQVLVFGEFGDFLQRTAGHRAGPLAGMRQQLNQVFDGETLDNYTSGGARNKRTVRAENHRMSLLAGATPRHMNLFTSEIDWEGGFMGRMMLCLSDVERDYPAQPRHKYWDQLCLDFREIAATSRGPCNGFTPDATKYLVKWYAKRAGTWSEHSKARYLEAAENRMLALARSLALVFASDPKLCRPRGTKPWRIPKDCVKPACAMVDMHMQSFESIVGFLSANQFERIQGNIMLHLEDGAMPHVKLLRKVEPRLSKREFENVINTLVETGEVLDFLDGDCDTYYACRESDVPDDAMT